jgi:hypothetical protein
VSEEGTVVPLFVGVEFVASAVGAGVVAVFVVELPAFFFAFGVAVVCAGAIDPATKNALTQKLAANFRYLFINPSCTRSVHPSLRNRVDTTSASTIPLSCGPQPAVVQTKYSSLLRQI